MLIAGSADTVAPALLEQIQPFTWLTSPNKYLVLMNNGTHFSTIEESPSKRISAPTRSHRARTSFSPSLSQRTKRSFHGKLFEQQIKFPAVFGAILRFKHLPRHSRTENFAIVSPRSNSSSSAVLHLLAGPSLHLSSLLFLYLLHLPSLPFVRGKATSVV